MTAKLTATIIMALILVGCARWQHLDGSNAGLDEITRAKLVCDYDASLVALQTRQLAKDTAVLSTSDPDEKEALEKEYQSRAREVYNKLNACMKDQGLQKIP